MEIKLKSKSLTNINDYLELENRIKKLKVALQMPYKYESHSKFQEIVIETKDLWKRYFFWKNYVLKNVNLKIYKGDIHGLIGENGAGKTTLMKCLVGALCISKGKAWIYGKNVNDVEVKKYLGYVPETANFDNDKNDSVKKYLFTLATLNGLKGDKKIEKVNYVIDTMHIRELANFVPYRLSTGQKKKVLIAQALLSNPKLLILDEPTAGLDPISRTFILEKLKSLAIKESITILISSHVLTELQEYVTGWTFIDKGKIIINDSLNQDDINEGVYKLQTNSNKKTYSYLKNHNVNVSLEGKWVYVKCDSIKDVLNMQSIIFGMPFKIIRFEKTTVNLQVLFNKLVGEKSYEK